MLGRRTLVTLFVVSLTLRLALLVVLGSHRRGAETAHLEHRTIARNLAEGRGFAFNFFGVRDEPTSQQAPLVPSVLAAGYLLFGVESPAAFFFVLVLECIASSLTVVAIALVAESLASGGESRRREGDRSRRIGLIAGSLAALYPPLLASAFHVQSLVWNLACLAGLLLATVWLREGKVGSGSVLFAFSSLLGLLTDPIAGVVVAGLWALVALESAARRDVRLASALVATAAVVACGLAPWVARNYVVHGRFVPMKDSFGYVFWEGNNRISWGTDKLPVETSAAGRLAEQWNPLAANRAAFEVRGAAVSVDSCLTTEELAELRSLPREIDRMDWFGRQALADLREDPSRYARLCLTRLWFWAWFDATNPRSYVWHYRLSYLSLAVLAVFGVPAVLRSWRNWTPVFVAAAGLSAVHVFIITSARFRIPLELLLIIPASITIYSIFSYIINRPADRTTNVRRPMAA